MRNIVVTATPAQLGDALERHREHVEALRARGRLRFSGAYADGGGFIEVFEAADRHESEALTRDSPLVERGLAAWTLRRLDG